MSLQPPVAVVTGAGSGIGLACARRLAADASPSSSTTSRPSPPDKPVCPGPIHTPALERFVPDFDFYRRQLPMGRPASAEVAAVVSFLAGPDSSYVSGVALPVDGAMGARLAAPARTVEELMP
jgi:NAD(P)-dependent dehydrogenase (short-subunit alcohol dehydrogenase family)